MDNDNVQEQQSDIQQPYCEEPISVKEWLITSLIMIIPIVGIVMLFVWAFGDKVKKSKSNYCKAYLGMILIAFVFVLGFSVIATNIQIKGEISAEEEKAEEREKEKEEKEKEAAIKAAEKEQRERDYELNFTHTKEQAVDVAERFLKLEVLYSGEASIIRGEAIPQKHTDEEEQFKFKGYVKTIDKDGNYVQFDNVQVSVIFKKGTFYEHKEKLICME